MTAMTAVEAFDHGVLRFVTAGSVDDGKSTLIGRLLYDTKAILADQLAAIERTSQRRGTALDLSLLTDGLTAEREQGITIDVAYRYFATPLRKFIIADAPGHEQYTRNMVTAASTAQVAVLLIDARHGVVTQTRRHATLADLVGIPLVVVAVNKMDLVRYDRQAFARIVRDFEQFAQRNAIRAEVRFVPISAAFGDMVVERGERLSWYEGPTLLSILEAAEFEESLAARPLRLPVQLVGRPGDGLPRRYLGRIETGSVAEGDTVEVLPSGRRSRVRELRTHDGRVATAGLHAAVQVVLEDALDVSRGDMIVHAGKGPAVTQRITATLCWLGDAALDARRAYVLRHTTREVRARVTAVESRWDVNTQQHESVPATLRTNDIARVRLEAAQPLCVDLYSELRPTGGFVLIDEATNGTVAAGLVESIDA